MTELTPVGYYCDHSDEPHDARTHHDWEWVEGEGHVFQHSPNTVGSHSGTRDWLTPKQREQRCPREVPVYAGPDVDRLLAENAELEKALGLNEDAA